MVRLVGIEPTAPWFVAKYSNPLSYRRILIKKHYTGIFFRFNNKTHWRYT